MSYSKCWQKCLAKIEQYTSMPAEKWNHYQLLGYLLSKTSQKFEPLNLEETNIEFLGTHKTEPSSHPMLESVRYVYREFNKCPIRTKEFLDWCLSKYNTKLSIKGLRNLCFYYQNNTTTTSINTTSIPDRSDRLPKNLKELFSDLGLSTYGELSNLRNDDRLTLILIEKLSSIDCTIESLKLDKIS